MKLDLASDFRHQRDYLNGPYTDDDFNEALWEIDEMLHLADALREHSMLCTVAWGVGYPLQGSVILYC